MHCCVCTGVCGHIGGPWYCDMHKPRYVPGGGYFHPIPNYIPPRVNKCDMCGSTAIDHTEKDCRLNRGLSSLTPVGHSKERKSNHKISNIYKKKE